MKWAFPLAIVRGLWRRSSHGSRKSNKLLLFTQAGITLSVCVMLVATAVGSGFRGTVLNHLRFLSGDLEVSLLLTEEGDTPPFCAREADHRAISSLPEVAHTVGVIEAMAVTTQERRHKGIALTGISTYQHLADADRILLEGSWKDFEQYQEGQPPAYVSTTLAKEMGLTVGDRMPIILWVPGKKPTVRKVLIAGILDIPSLEIAHCVVPYEFLRRALDLPPDSFHRLEIYLGEGVDPHKGADAVVNYLAHSSLTEEHPLGLLLAAEKYPRLFAWVQMLDGNLWLLLIILALVAGFSLSVGLLILVLDTTRMIGLLKALGATRGDLGRLFLLLSFRIVLGGVLCGTLLAGLLVWLQSHFHLLPLDSTVYYVSYIPTHIVFWQWGIIILAALLLSLLVLFVPLGLIERIKPQDTLHFE